MHQINYTLLRFIREEKYLYSKGLLNHKKTLMNVMFLLRKCCEITEPVYLKKKNISGTQGTRRDFVVIFFQGAYYYYNLTLTFHSHFHSRSSLSIFMQSVRFCASLASILSSFYLFRLCEQSSTNNILSRCNPTIWSQGTRIHAFAHTTACVFLQPNLLSLQT